MTSIVRYGNEVFENIITDSSVELNETTVTGVVQTLSSVVAHSCLKLSKIHAGLDIHLDGCTVAGDVTAKGVALVVSSTIQGRLTCGNKELKVDCSNIDSIKIQKVKGVSVRLYAGPKGSIQVERIKGMNTSDVVKVTLSDNSVQEYNASVYDPSKIMVDGQILSSCSFENKSLNESSIQVVKLVKSNVKTITFENGNGQVLVDSDSKVTGEIIGGVLVK